MYNLYQIRAKQVLAVQLLWAHHINNLNTIVLKPGVRPDTFDSIHIDSVHFNSMHFDSVHFDSIHFHSVHFDSCNNMSHGDVTNCIFHCMLIHTKTVFFKYQFVH